MTSVFYGKFHLLNNVTKRDDEGVAAKPSARMGGHVRRRRMCVPYVVVECTTLSRKNGRRNASPTRYGYMNRRGHVSRPKKRAGWNPAPYGDIQTL